MKLQQLFCSSVIAGYLLVGLGCGWLAPTLQRYKNSDSEFSLDTQACSFIASLHYAGRSTACLFVAPLIDRLGRNKIICFNAICSCICWLAVRLTKSIPLHYAIRVLFGLGTASLDVAGGLYIGENSSPKFRGIFGSMCSLAFYIGELIAFIVSTYCSYETTAILFASISLTALLSTVLLKEPAQYLLAEGHYQKAEKRFFRFRGATEIAKQEFEQINLALSKPKEPITVGLLVSKSMRAVCIVNCYLYITGYAPINGMSSMAFFSIKNITPNDLTILLGIMQLVSIFFSSTIIERIGRRPIMIISAAIGTCIHISIAAVYYCHEIGISIPHFAWILFALITSYAILAAAIVIPLMTTIRGELLSPQLKAVGGSIAMFFNSIFSLGWAALFLPIAELYGMKTNFLWFGIMSFIALIYIYFDLPETRGLTLTEIQLSLNQKEKSKSQNQTRELEQP